MTYREIIYMVLDQARLISDDITLNEEHALFLIDKYRALLLSQKYKSVKTEVPEANYQTLCLNLEQVCGTTLCDGPVLRSTEKLPNKLGIGNDVVTPYDYFKGINFSFIARERMRYVGYNKFLRNIIYCTIGPDNYLYIKSSNPQFQHLSKVKVTGVFDSSATASNLLCDSECELFDREFPLEESLVAPVIDSVVKELVGAAYRPKDDRNNASDEADKIAATKK